MRSRPDDENPTVAAADVRARSVLIDEASDLLARLGITELRNNKYDLAQLDRIVKLYHVRWLALKRLLRRLYSWEHADDLRNEVKEGIWRPLSEIQRTARERHAQQLALETKIEAEERTSKGGRSKKKPLGQLAKSLANKNKSVAAGKAGKT